MAKRDNVAFDEAVLAALKAAGNHAVATYVVRNWMDRPMRPATCRPVLASLRRLQRAGVVRLAYRSFYARQLEWELAEVPG